MGIKSICIGVAGTAFALSLASSAFAASEIKNSDDCAYEGGTMTNVKGSDYCLVQIRPEEYSGEEYDGNQLGVVECPGDKLNDGIFCMYPVTIRPQPAAETTPIPATNSLLQKAGDVVSGAGSDGSVKDKAAMELLKNKVTGGEKSTTDVLVDVAKDEAKKKAEDEAKKKASSLLGGN
jgi:hypothetical protein